MKWIPLDSTVFKSAAYAATRKVLYLRFRESGDTYRYLDVPAEEYQAFLAADSQGRYFASHIREQYRSERLAKLQQVLTKRARG